jgi:O-antigen ligase
MKAISVTNKESYFSKEIQYLINWFVFFLVFPALNILGNSITFYLFLLIIIKVGFSFFVFTNKTKWFIFLLLSLILSTLFMPKMMRHPGILATIKFNIQFFYWIFISLFFIKYYKLINLLKVSKLVFYGSLCSIFGFYILRLNFDFGPLRLTFFEQRNSFVFNLLCSIPFSFIYINQKFKNRTKLFWLFFLFSAMMLTNGRSGGVIVIVEALLISIIIFPSFTSSLKFIIVAFLFFSLLFSFSSDKFTGFFASAVSKFNPRLSKLILNEENDDEGDLAFDKSWLHRQLMVDKSLEIFSSYPILGIGPNSFRYYDAELNTYFQYIRLGNKEKDWYNNRSAHNSYIQILSELGLFGFLLLIIIIMTPILYFIKNLIIAPRIILLPFVSLIGISIHFYVISALTGAICWFIFGICWAILKNKSF